jgi:hypothetical protein
MRDGSVGMVTSLPGIQARYFGSNMVTDIISLYSKVAVRVRVSSASY